MSGPSLLGALAGCANEGVAVVKYSYESTPLSKLLHLVSVKLKGRPALSIALVMEGSQNTLKICTQKVRRKKTKKKVPQKRGHPDLNWGPLELQLNALPLSYAPRLLGGWGC